MTFAKELISKDDFEKYQIGRFAERISNSLHPGSEWVIDRSRNIYLISVPSFEREPEFINTHNFILYIDDFVYVISMSLGLTKVDDKKWLLQWKDKYWNFLKFFSKNEKNTISGNHLKELFKQAMNIYRFNGIDENFDAEIEIKFEF